MRLPVILLSILCCFYSIVSLTQVDSVGITYSRITLENYQKEFTYYDNLKLDSVPFTNNNSMYYDYEEYYQEHILYCTNDSIELKDHFDPSDDWMHWTYGYFGYLDTLDIHIIEVIGYEWTSYVLVDDKTCAISDTLGAPPLFSANANLILQIDSYQPKFMEYLVKTDNQYETKYYGELKPESNLFYHLDLDRIEQHYWLGENVFRYKTLVEYQGELVNEYYELKFSFSNE